MILPWATSRPFVATDNLHLLGRVAETWGCRPSALLGLEGEARFRTVALQIDVAAAAALWKWNERASAESGAVEEWW